MLGTRAKVGDSGLILARVFALARRQGDGKRVVVRGKGAGTATAELERRINVDHVAHILSTSPGSGDCRVKSCISSLPFPSSLCAGRNTVLFLYRMSQKQGKLRKLRRSRLRLSTRLAPQAAPSTPPKTLSGASPKRIVRIYKASNKLALLPPPKDRLDTAYGLPHPRIPAPPARRLLTAARPPIATQKPSQGTSPASPQMTRSTMPLATA